MSGKKPNALAAVRMMVESDDEEEEEDAKSLSNEEFLRLHFESSQPEQPIKSILKRKELKQDLSGMEVTLKKTNNGTLENEECRNKLDRTLNNHSPPQIAGDCQTKTLVSAKDDEADGKEEVKDVEINATRECSEEPGETKVSSQSGSVESTALNNSTPLESKVKRNNNTVTQSGDLCQTNNVPTSNNVDTSVDIVQDNLNDTAKENNTLSQKNTSSNRFFMRITGLTQDFTKRDLMIFFGVWPSNGSDGVRIITNSNGERNGCAYFEVERQQDKMDFLRMSGMPFNTRKIKTQLSSEAQMEKDWEITKHATLEVQQSQFVRLSNLNTSSSKEDIFKALAKFKLKPEDVYCFAPNKDTQNNGTVYIAADSSEVAEEICSQPQTIGERSVFAAKVHPNVFFEWCASNKVPQDRVAKKTEKPKEENASDSGSTTVGLNKKNIDAVITPKNSDDKKKTTVKSTTSQKPQDQGPRHLAPNITPRPNGPFPMPPHHMGPMAPMCPPFMPGPNMMGPPRMMPMRPGGRLMGPGPPGMMRPPGMRPGPPMGPRGFMPTIYMRMYNLPEQATTEDIKAFFAPVVPAKIAQNTGYNIFDIDFYTPDDNAMAIRRQGMLIRKNAISLEMLPGPPIPLPPRPHIPPLLNRKRETESVRTRRREPSPRRSRSPPRNRPKRREYSPRRRSPDRYNHRRRKSRWEEDRNPKPEKRKRTNHDVAPEKRVETIIVEPFPEDPFKYRLLPFDATKPAGQCAIQVMQGFFCQLCRKFYNSETAGKVSHCKTKSHYDKVKEHLQELKRQKENPG